MTPIICRVIMIVEFRSNKLRKCFEIHKEAQKAWGNAIARRYLERINVLMAVKEIEDLKKFPQFRFHALTGDRKGQYALNLDGFYRLIFTLSDETVQIITIEEVSKHYGN